MANSDRRRSSASSTDIDLLRRSSIVSNISAQSAGETEKEARKRKLEGSFDQIMTNYYVILAWAKEERRKSVNDAEKAEKLKQLRAQILAKKAKLLKMQEEASSDSSDSDSSESSDD